MVIVSECCTGVCCRYNGRGVVKKRVESLSEEYIVVCPEVMGGLPTPREGCDVTRAGTVIGRKTGRDYTAAYLRGARRVLRLCHQHSVKKAYLLRNSPSCGKGYGLTAKLLESHGIKVIAI